MPLKVTHILLQSGAPNCDRGGYETLEVDAHISDCADSDSEENEPDAELCIP